MSKYTTSFKSLIDGGFVTREQIENIFKSYQLSDYLTTDEIDEIMGRDYSNGEKWEHVLKTFTDSEGEEQSYWTVENVNKIIKLTMME